MSTSQVVQRSAPAPVKFGLDRMAALAAVLGVAITLLVLGLVAGTSSHVRTAVHPMGRVAATAVGSPSTSVPAGFVRDPTTHALLPIGGGAQALTFREHSYGATP